MPTIESRRSFAPTWLATHRLIFSREKEHHPGIIDSSDGTHTKRNRGEFNDLDRKTAARSLGSFASKPSIWIWAEHMAIDAN